MRRLLLGWRGRGGGGSMRWKPWFLCVVNVKPSLSLQTLQGWGCVWNMRKRRERLRSVFGGYVKENGRLLDFG